ncbi:GNAT family N-acetyltransferase [Chitinophaga japonensis]|uniref:FR47-like protein n=1 Tax=Chitinophaga japonensis TaxID=104662 RepID=A0A562TCR9_CHIJA|nr:GNAT family N-acetyltransferase [Chitinophaga japonensis]TWI91285.1 FR47-like protein [Chitinophaga japonensis]
MQTEVIKTTLADIRAFRLLFLQERRFQFVHDKCHLYGWADTYLFLADGMRIGYGAIWGHNKREDRDAIFEFYLLPPYRKLSNRIFPLFHSASGAFYIECQSNDALLASLLYEYARNINAEAILFEDHYTTQLQVPGVVFRRPGGPPDGYDAGGYALEQAGETVATGGLMLNYNMPYADIYMDVKESCRQQGLGSLLVQELKKEAYSMGRVPSARCNIRNLASKATLLKAGFRECGFILKGEIL